MTQSTGLPRIKRSQTLDELAYQQIKKAIITGVFKPGEFLPEIQVAQDLGISKTPVRKALGRLQQERFLVNVPFEGYYVADISVQDIAEIYQLRTILECFLVGETVDKFTTDELDAMSAILDDADQALEQGDHLHYVELNRDFHHAFDRKHGNQRISAVLSNLDEHVQRILLQVVAGRPEEYLNSHREHRVIMNALYARDREAAIRSMEGHLKRFCDTLVARRQVTAQQTMTSDSIES